MPHALHRLFRAGLLIALAVLAVPLLPGDVRRSLGGFGHVLDLVSHWQWLALILLAACGLVCMARDRRYGFALAAMGLPFLTAAPRADVDPDTGSTFTVVSANVFRGTQSPTALAAWIASSSADAVVLLEVTPDYAEALRDLPMLPFRQIAAEPGAFGIALLSRHPFAEVRTVRDAQDLASIDAAIETPEGCVRLRAVHPIPPIDASEWLRRDRRLDDAVTALPVRDVPALVVGDFNATPWSSAFSGWAERGWRRALGLAPTWPSWGGGIVGIPIDQVLINAAWSGAVSARGPTLGSDHAPVRATLRRAIPGAACGVTL